MIIYDFLLYCVNDKLLQFEDWDLLFYLLAYVNQNYLTYMCLLDNNNYYFNMFTGIIIIKILINVSLSELFLILWLL